MDASPLLAGGAFLIEAEREIERPVMQGLTPQFFDTVIIVVIILGLAFAVVRLYQDFTRPLPPVDPPERSQHPTPTGGSRTGNRNPTGSSRSAKNTRNKD
jgi:hypothetical protein